MSAFRVAAASFVTFPVLFAAALMPFLVRAADVCDTASEAAKGIVSNDCIACVPDGRGGKKPVGASCIVTEGGSNTKANCTPDSSQIRGVCKVKYQTPDGKWHAVDTINKPTDGSSFAEKIGRLESAAPAAGRASQPTLSPVTPVPDRSLFQYMPTPDVEDAGQDPFDRPDGTQKYLQELIDRAQANPPQIEPPTAPQKSFLEQTLGSWGISSPETGQLSPWTPVDANGNPISEPINTNTQGQTTGFDNSQSLSTEQSCNSWWCSIQEWYKHNILGATSVAANNAEKQIGVDANGYIDKEEFYKAAVEKFRASSLNGDARGMEKFGVSGTPESWAGFALKLCELESGGCRVAAVNKDGSLKRFSSTRSGENSFGPLQFNKGEYGLPKWADVNNPDKVIDAFIKVAEQGKLNAYFGPIKNSVYALQDAGQYYTNFAQAPSTPTLASVDWPAVTGTFEPPPVYYTPPRVTAGDSVATQWAEQSFTLEGVNSTPPVFNYGGYDQSSGLQGGFDPQTIPSSIISQPILNEPLENFTPYPAGLVERGPDLPAPEIPYPAGVVTRGPDIEPPYSTGIVTRGSDLEQPYPTGAVARGLDLPEPEIPYPAGVVTRGPDLEQPAPITEVTRGLDLPEPATPYPVGPVEPGQDLPPAVVSPEMVAALRDYAINNPPEPLGEQVPISEPLNPTQTFAQILEERIGGIADWTSEKFDNLKDAFGIKTDTTEMSVNEARLAEERTLVDQEANDAERRAALEEARNEVDNVANAEERRAALEEFERQHQQVNAEDEAKKLQAEREMAEAQTERARLEAERQDLEKQVRDAEQEKKNQQEALRASQEELERLKKLPNADRLVDQMKRGLDALAKNSQPTAADRAAMQAGRNASAQLERLAREAGDDALTNRLRSLNSRLSSLGGQADQLARVVNEKYGGSYVSAYMASEPRLTSLMTNRDSAVATGNALASSVNSGALSRSINEFRAELQSDIASARTEISNHTRSISTWQSNIAAFDNTISNLNTQIASNQGELARLASIQPDYVTLSPNMTPQVGGPPDWTRLSINYDVDTDFDLAAVRTEVARMSEETVTRAMDKIARWTDSFENILGGEPQTNLTELARQTAIDQDPTLIRDPESGLLYPLPPAESPVLASSDTRVADVVQTDLERYVAGVQKEIDEIDSVVEKWRASQQTPEPTAEQRAPVEPPSPIVVGTSRGVVVPESQAGPPLEGGGGSELVEPSTRTPFQVSCSNSSIVDCLNDNNMRTDLNSRKQLAEQMGLRCSVGTASCNAQMLEALQTRGTPIPLPYSRPSPENPYTLARNYSGNSVVDFLDQARKPSDFASRAALAQQLGVANYDGTSAQNTQLLKLLRSTIR